MKRLSLSLPGRFLAGSSVTLGIAMGILGLSLLDRGQETNFEEVAQGDETTSVFLNYENKRIHCGDLRDADECLDGITEGESVGVLLGNSMLHAVNQYKPGEVTSPYLMHETLIRNGLNLLTFSQPNANLQEHFLLFEYLVKQLPIKVLILPVVFDDTREDGLRQGFEGILNDPHVKILLNASVTGRDLLMRFSARLDAEDPDLAGVQGSFQEHSEKFLNKQLDQRFELWAHRPDFRGKLFLELYYLRNSVFGVNPSSKRRVIPARYQRNMAALDDLLASASSFDVDVLVYIPPIRHDAEWPYRLSEYGLFKSDIEQAVDRHGATVVNLESAVPDVYWGMKDATNSGGGVELDFMHFQAKGHELLAECLVEALRDRRIVGADD